MSDDIRRLGERYELGEVIGRGGMAEVHEGTDLRLGRRVAVKILRPDLARDPSFQARFRREAQSAASLNHPNIVAVYDTGEDVLADADGTGDVVPYIVMEYVDGMTLRQLMLSGRRLLPERALEITAGTLAALDYSHRHGIVHRDIKPANVMLTRGGDVKVMDFGIARALADSGQTMTQQSAVLGTAHYLSPEQARGEVVDSRSDIYSTGCLLYELLTGRPPFTGESPVSIAYQHVSEQPVPPSQLDPAVTAADRHDRAHRARQAPGGPLPDRGGDARRRRARDRRPARHRAGSRAAQRHRRDGTAGRDRGVRRGRGGPRAAQPVVLGAAHPRRDRRRHRARCSSAAPSSARRRSRRSPCPTSSASPSSRPRPRSPRRGSCSARRHRRRRPPCPRTPSSARTRPPATRSTRAPASTSPSRPARTRRPCPLWA